MTTALKLVRSPSSEAELTGLHRANDDRCWPAAVANVLTPFVAWLDRFGETSYDHQSLYAGPIGGRAKALYYRRPRIGTLVVAPMILCEAFLPSARRWFGHPLRFPIADAHYAMGFALLAEATGEADRAISRRQPTSCGTGNPGART